MRGPEEAMNAEDTTRSSSGEGGKGNEGRDPCSSPPFKRFKQAVLNFQSNSSTNGSPLSSSPPHLSNGVPKEVVVIHDDDRTPNCGGLVTAAPSPPEKGHLKPPSSAKDQKDDENQPDISNCTVPIDKPSDAPKSNIQEINCSPKQTSPNNTKTPLKPTSAEKKKLKEEKQKLKEEKERQRQEAKAQKEKEKLEAKQKKEQERLKKQAEKEKKEKERLEKKQREEREKQEKKEKKEEERRKKEEGINAKLEEKRKKEEEKKQQEEELKRKKMQESLSFKSFFTKTTNAPPKTLPKAGLKFEPFEIKPHMSLAPVLRIQPSKESQQQLDKSMQEQNNVPLYMEGLQKQKPLPPYRKERRRTIAAKSSNQEDPAEKTKKKDNGIEISDDETSDSESVVEIQQDEKKRMKVIFLKFHENNRPPYYGTQRKKSKMISPRNPLNKDEGLLNYEVDSDDEWEEEEPGESLSDDDSGDDDEADDGEEEDDGFMVPHGYLSDDEGIDAEDEENEVDSTSKEAQQLAKVKAWEAELKRKCKAKKPVCVGCVWPDERNINEMLQQFEAFLLVDEPTIAIRSTSSATSVDSCFQPLSENIAATPDSVYKSGMFVPEEAMPDLIKLIHRSSAGVVKLMEYFKQHWSKKCENTKAHPTLAGKGHISKRKLEAKIKAIATKERRNDKPRWYVHDNILEAYSLAKLATIDNSQGMPHSTISCSPQVSNTNTGIQVVATSVSPSENRGQSSMMKISPQQLQTDNNGTQDNLKSAAPVAKQMVVLQPIPTPEEGSSIVLLNLQNSSAGKSLQTQSDKQKNIVKQRVVLQPVTKTEEGPGITKANLQSSFAEQTLQVKRRVVLQPVAKLDVGGGSAKENQPTQQGISTECNVQLQNDKQLLVTPVAKRRVALQPVSKPDTAKDNQTNPPPSGVKQICDNVETPPPMRKPLIRKPEQDITHSNPPQGLMKTSLVSAISIPNSLSTPSSGEVIIPNDARCTSSAVKRTAPSPVGADRAAKVPRKSEESVQIHRVNMPTETTPAMVDMASCPQSQPSLHTPQHSKEPQESGQKPISETANLKNSNSSKEIQEGVLVKNYACKTDGVQPMEIETIKA